MSLIWNIRYEGPNCPDGCSPLTLNAGAVANCPDDYKLTRGEIRSLYISAVTENSGTIEAATKPSNWLSSDGYGGLVHLIGVGDKPKGDPITLPLPGYENRTIDRTHTLNFDSTDSKQEVMDLVRAMQCGKKVAIWYITHDCIAFGGPDGIICDTDPGTNLARGETPLANIFTFTWRNKFDPLSGEVAQAASMTVGPGPAQFKAPAPPPLPKKGKSKAA